MEEVKTEDVSNNSCCVYAHVNKINGKMYIGWTSQIPENRWGSNGCKYNKKYHSAFYNAIQKYGLDNFEHIIVEDKLSEADAKMIEKNLIALYKTNISKWGDKAMGYNLTDGGDGCSGYKHTEESKKKMKEPHLGRSVPEDVRKRISEKLKGKVVSEDTRKKLSASAKNTMTEERKQYLREINLGRQHTQEAKDKMRDCKIGKPLSEQHKQKLSECSGVKRAVVQLLKNGELVTEYKSMLDAEHITGINNASICLCCQYKRKSAGGYVWRYKDELEEIQIAKNTDGEN